MWLTQSISPADAEPAKGGVPVQAPSQPPSLAAGGGSDAQMTDIHDIKPILELGGDWQWLIYLAGALTVLTGLLVLAWWLWKRRKRPEAVFSTAPPIPPDAEAYTALDALAADKGLDPKQFYFRLSAVLRHYMERRFDFPAAEMTTEELLPQVDQMTLDSSLALELKAFCRQTDPIKFAGASARQDRLAQDLAFSRNFVRQTTDTQEESEN
jgi:hypothetical protein